MPAHKVFQAVFHQLRIILKKYESRLVVESDTAQGYSLNTRYSDKYKKPLFFGAAQIKKNYVSYYLMSVYACPDLLDGISPQLKARMQGKSYFNFKAIDAAQLKELSRLTRRGFERSKKEGLVSRVSLSEDAANVQN